jgi:hypothetical protein
MRACLGGCSWVGEKLCSACAPPADEVITALCLVSGTDHITDDQVREWTVDQCADAFAWAMAVHFFASDNPDVVVPPRPSFTMPTLQEVPHG